MTMGSRLVRCLAMLILLLASVGGGRAQAGSAGCRIWLPDFDRDCEREGRFGGFVPPMSAPFTFEEPFITSGLRLWAVHNEIPDSAIVGGDARVYAVQARLALTDRLAFVATKDGFVDFNPDLALLDGETGFADLTAGFKFALIQRPEAQFILTPSLRYHSTQGSRDVLSGNGEGAWIPGASTAWGIGKLHLVADVGARLPIDGDAESTPLFYNLHLSYELFRGLVPFTEINGIHYLDEGSGETTIRLGNGAYVPISGVQALFGSSGFDGNDVLNLGSDEVKGHNIVSLALGAQIPLTRRVILGAAYEFPITTRRDLLERRFSLSVSLEL